MSTIFNRDDDAAPQTAARGAPRATLGMRLYDDLPEVKTAAKGDAEGGGDEGRGWGGTGPTGRVGDRTASERDASAGASGSGGETKKSSSSAAGMLRAQATALRAAQARTKREAEARRAAAAAAAKKKKRAASKSTAPASEAEAGESGDKVHAPCSSGEEEAEEPVTDAYDPSAPNDYERTLAARGERARRKRDLDVNEDLRKTLEERRKAMEAQKMSERTARREEILNVSGREARRRRVALRSENDKGEAPERPSASAPKLSAAEKMMAKMGWTKGRGLGKTEQGMKTPLEVRGTTGKIVNAAPVMFEVPPSGGLGAKSTPKKSVAKPLNGKPTTVLLLRNVVLRGEVEETLEDEIADECEKFGNVVQVLIFEVTEQSFAADEAVRVFVEFVDEEAAARAGAALNGRFFGKRVIKASYYELHKLDVGDLGPQKGEE